LLAAVVQMTATSDVEATWRQAEDGIRVAASRGARFVATPENSTYLGPHADKVRLAEPVDGPAIGRFRALAAELGIHVLVGSFNEAAPGEPGRCFNTSVLLAPDGSVAATYRKLHLFDVDVPDGPRFQESATTAPGRRIATTAIGPHVFGLSICYDLRFPELYRCLADAGATVLTVPAAFTAQTGKDHWEVLLRARAIETQCWVLAPGQCGRHDDGGLRNSHGHSMIVDPWGHVVARCSDGPGVAVADLDPHRVARVRRAMPVADHRRIPLEMS
jgi:predicted amidohydrolase